MVVVAEHIWASIKKGHRFTINRRLGQRSIANHKEKKEKAIKTKKYSVFLSSGLTRIFRKLAMINVISVQYDVYK